MLFLAVVMNSIQAVARLAAFVGLFSGTIEPREEAGGAHGRLLLFRSS
jgi:hypothetical protein